MKQKFTIPSKEMEMETDYMTFYLSNRQVSVHTTLRNPLDPSDTKNMSKTFDVMQLFQDAGLPQSRIDDFVQIIKGIVARAWDQSVAEITEDPFAEPTEPDIPV